MVSGGYVRYIVLYGVQYIYIKRLDSIKYGLNGICVTEQYYMTKGRKSVSYLIIVMFIEIYIISQKL